MSIKNRHTMAAFLVAILCITTIFSLFPVTAFAAGCDHFFVGEGPSPTCTEDGYSIQVCQICGLTDGDKFIYPATGHSYENGVCLSCGADEPCSHFYALTFVSNGDGTHEVYEACSNCGDELSKDVVSCSFNDGCCACGYEEPSSDGSGGSSGDSGGSSGDSGGSSGDSSGDVCGHYGDTSSDYRNITASYHDRVTICLSCFKEIGVITESHDFSSGECECGETCPHSSYITYFTALDNKTHSSYKLCKICGVSFGNISSEACTFGVNGLCACGNASSSACKHEKINKRYEPLNNGKHREISICANTVCTYQSADVVACTYNSTGVCVYCLAESPLFTAIEGVPDGAILAYVYLDDQGRWTVHSDKYFGGVNRFNILDYTFYVHNNNSVRVTHYTSNSVVVQDLDGAVNKSNSKVVDLNSVYIFGLVEGEEYTFVANVDSPWENSVILLKVSGDNDKYLKPGEKFVYKKGMIFYINIKTNSSTTKSYGEPFTMKITDIGVIPSYDEYEPYGVRYFNNDVSYYSYVNSMRLLSGDLGGYAAALDYYYNSAYGTANKSKYKDYVVNHGGYSILHNFDMYYEGTSSIILNKNGDYYALYEKLVDGTVGSYNQGYTDGYGSAVRDFEDVTDGGMVEGMINGAFNSVSDSWNILNSGVSISGISVGGIVSSVVIIIVVYFALKVIQR